MCFIYRADYFSLDIRSCINRKVIAIPLNFTYQMIINQDWIAGIFLCHNYKIKEADLAGIKKEHFFTVFSVFMKFSDYPAPTILQV